MKTENVWKVMLFMVIYWKRVTPGWPLPPEYTISVSNNLSPLHPLCHETLLCPQQPEASYVHSPTWDIPFALLALGSVLEGSGNKVLVQSWTPGQQDTLLQGTQQRQFYFYIKFSVFYYALLYIKHPFSMFKVSLETFNIVFILFCFDLFKPAVIKRKQILIKIRFKNQLK